jgi:hypothetical protein
VTAAASTPTGAVRAVQDLERALDVQRRGRADAERRLQEARRRAGELLRDARAEAASEARRRQAEILATADEDAAGVLSGADATAIALHESVRASRPQLLAAMRTVVLPRPAIDEDR